MSKQEENQRIANVSEILTNATEDHKGECYDTILLIMANKKHTAFAYEGDFLGLGFSLTKVLLRNPEMIPVIQSSVLTAIDLLQNPADTNEEK